MNIPASSSPLSALTGVGHGLPAPSVGAAGEGARDAASWFLQAEGGGSIAWPQRAPDTTDVKLLAQRVLGHLLAEGG